MARRIKLILQPVKFRKREHIAVISLNNPEVDDVVREFENAEWSTGYRFWHIPYSAETLNYLIDTLKTFAQVDSSAFKNYIQLIEPIKKEKRFRARVEEPNPGQKKILKALEAEFHKNYSSSTVKIYMCLLNVFFGWYNTKNEEEITKNEVHLFIHEYIEKNGYTLNYKRLMINALRRYFQYRGIEIQLEE